MEEFFHYVIVGGGIAGVTCAEHINILHPEERILLLTAHGVIKAVADVVAHTKFVHSFNVVEKTPNCLAEELSGVDVRQEAVKLLDSKQKVIQTELGKNYKYGKLCICTGATPKIIDPSNPYVLVIRDTETAAKLQDRLRQANRIVIVGNGGIATELVYEIEDLEIVWAIKDSSPNAVFMDPGAAEFLKSSIYEEKNTETKSRRREHVSVVAPSENTTSDFIGESLGPHWHSGLVLKGMTERRVTLETEVEVTQIIYRDDFIAKFPLESCDRQWPIYVELSNGRKYGCDLLISATGVTPNVSPFLPGNDFKLGEDGGLSVNDRMQTSVIDVYAAGDVCTAEWIHSQHWFQRRLWTQARQMGSYAAKCMWASVVKEEIYMDFCFELFTHVTKFFGKQVILLGLFNGQNLNNQYELLLRMVKGEEYIKCIIVEGKMQGAVLIGDTGLEETFENLILNQIDISFLGAQLLDPNVDIDDYFD